MEPARWIQGESGSAVAEFVLVGALLTVLTLSVIQLALALLVRNTVLDAASEGARYAALADNSAEDGVSRTRDLITTAIGGDYARDIRSSEGSYHGRSAVTIEVRAPLPVLGLLGPSRGLEVSGHAPRESVP